MRKLAALIVALLVILPISGALADDPVPPGGGGGGGITGISDDLGSTATGPTVQIQGGSGITTSRTANILTVDASGTTGLLGYEGHVHAGDVADGGNCGIQAAIDSFTTTNAGTVYLQHKSDCESLTTLPIKIGGPDKSLRAPMGLTIVGPGAGPGSNGGARLLYAAATASGSAVSVDFETTGTDEATITRSAGDWESDGVVAGMYIRMETAAGGDAFAAERDNWHWEVKSTTATVLTVKDPGDLVTGELGVTVDYFASYPIFEIEGAYNLTLRNFTIDGNDQGLGIVFRADAAANEIIVHPVIQQVDIRNVGATHLDPAIVCEGRSETASPTNDQVCSEALLEQVDIEDAGRGLVIDSNQTVNFTFDSGTLNNSDQYGAYLRSGILNMVNSGIVASVANSSGIHVGTNALQLNMVNQYTELTAGGQDEITCASGGRDLTLTRIGGRVLQQGTSGDWIDCTGKGGSVTIYGTRFEEQGGVTGDIHLDGFDHVSFDGNTFVNDSDAYDETIIGTINVGGETVLADLKHLGQVEDDTSPVLGGELEGGGFDIDLGNVRYTGNTIEHDLTPGLGVIMRYTFFDPGLSALYWGDADGAAGSNVPVMGLFLENDNFSSITGETGMMTLDSFGISGNGVDLSRTVSTCMINVSDRFEADTDCDFVADGILGAAEAHTSYSEATDCSAITGEGRFCWDIDDEILYIGNGGGQTTLNPAGTLTAVGPGCNSGACLTDGVATTGTELLVWEGTGLDGNELRFIVPENPGSDIDLTVPTSTGTIALTTDNVASATALAGDPTDCVGDTYAQSIDTAGALTCAQVAGDTGITDGSIVGDDLSTSLSLITTGTIEGRVDVVTESTTNCGGADIPETNLRGHFIQFTNAGATDCTLASANVGGSACFYRTQDARLDIRPQAGETITLEGQQLSSGESIHNNTTPAAGDFICLLATSATNWVTLGQAGDWDEETP